MENMVSIPVSATGLLINVRMDESITGFGRGNGVSMRYELVRLAPSN